MNTSRGCISLFNSPSVYLQPQSFNEKTRFGDCGMTEITASIYTEPDILLPVFKKTKRDHTLVTDASIGCMCARQKHTHAC